MMSPWVLQASWPIRNLRARVVEFIHARHTGVPGEYAYSVTGSPNLYSSCYALMTLHYLGALPESADARRQWAEYILGWQAPETGIFMGPELLEPPLPGAKHDFDHLAMHLTTTVLPCLDILGAQPRHPLTFAHRFLDAATLADWLHARDWSDAWLEGNNLLFVLQLLIHLRDDEKQPEAGARVEQFFDWLDAQVDPATGLWGTNGCTSNFVAMCGGYHQLLAYYYEARPVNSPERLVDVTLALQHADGGFHPRGGGGACEDVDAVDILVNLYKLHDYRRAEIRVALRKTVRSIFLKHMPDGGFVYRLGEPFSHMGMAATRTPANQSNMFATWFRLHTLALAAQVLQDTPLADVPWGFNPRLSMGWHPVDVAAPHPGWHAAARQEIDAVGMRRWIASRASPRALPVLSRLAKLQDALRS